MSYARVREVLLSTSVVGPFTVVVAGASAILFAGGYWIFVVGVWCVYSIAALGLLVPAGWVGEVSVGHAGVLAVAAYGANMLAASDAAVQIFCGMAFGALAGLVIGLPSLRLRGFGLAIVTLIFGEFVRTGIGNAPGLGGATGMMVAPPRFGGQVLSVSAIGIIAVTALALTLFVICALRRSTLGRAWRAIRDNEPLARAFGCDPRILRIAAFTLSGLFCGVAGVLFTWLTQYISPDSFNLWLSIYLLAIVVIGGRDEQFGPLVGAGVVVIAAEVLRVAGEIQAVVFGLMLFATVWLLPEGIVRAPLEALRRVRRAKARELARPMANLAEADAPRGCSGPQPLADAPVVLQAVDVARYYGGVRAVEGFNAAFHRGRVAAVVGPNGAGKTTLLDCLSGRAMLSRGAITLHGESVGALPPEARAHRGLARLFQDAELFRTLTVREALELAFDLLGRGATLKAGFGSDHRRRRGELVAASLDRFNLAQVADETLDKLSLGMSRVAGLACLYVSGADVWLLDEPASGLARAEVARIGALLRSLANEGQGRCIIMVEHDAGIVKAAADRILLLEYGRLVADAARDTPAWDEVLLSRSTSDTQSRAASPAVGAGDEAPRAGGGALTGRKISVVYGKFEAVRDIDLEVAGGAMRCLVGTNGAGKSTVMRCLAGLLTPTTGEVLLDGERLTAPAHVRASQHGVVLVAGGRTVFPHLTVAENLKLTARRDAALTFDPFTIFPELENKTTQYAGSLSGGEQQMLAIARALLMRPRFLLVDELTLGLSEVVGQRLLRALAQACRNDGLGVLLVEQDYRLALRWTSHAYVVAQGNLLFSGPSSQALERTDLFRAVFIPAD